MKVYALVARDSLTNVATLGVCTSETGAHAVADRLMSPVVAGTCPIGRARGSHCDGCFVDVDNCSESESTGTSVYVVPFELDGEVTLPKDWL